MRNLIIFGSGIVADAISCYFKRSKYYRQCAFCVDKEFINKSEMNGLPVISTDKLVDQYPPDNYELFIAIGFKDLNLARKNLYYRFKELGYKFASYIETESLDYLKKIGENSLILPGTTLQPNVSIGDNVFIWGNALIGHHVCIENHVWITGSASIGGGAKIGECCFVGLNATIGPSINIGERCLIGSNTLTTKNIDPCSVKVIADTSVHRLNCDQFLKLSHSLLL